MGALLVIIGGTIGTVVAMVVVLMAGITGIGCVIAGQIGAQVGIVGALLVHSRLTVARWA
jgi:hypothetical protein